jgi:uroporphyrinogen decarboxylase
VDTTLNVRALIDFLVNKKFVEELLDSIVECNNAVVDIVVQYNIDYIFYGDDWGQQKGFVMGLLCGKKFTSSI